MSYCRWGTESDCYIFHHAGPKDGEGFLTCLGCLLQPTPTGRAVDQPSYNTTSRGEMLAHVHTHRAVGHQVPDRVIDRLIREIAEEGDEVNDKSQHQPLHQERHLGQDGADSA